MKITKEWLDDAQRSMLGELDSGRFLFDEQEIHDLTRLARLGLWAEEHGIKKMRFLRDLVDGEWGEVHGIRDDIDRILAALPEEKK